VTCGRHDREGRQGVDAWSWEAIYSNRIILKYFKSKSNSFKLDLIQAGSFVAQNFEIKYGCEGFIVRNNLPYRNFARFAMDFELKFK
jgi:hypothetical protein